MTDRTALTRRPGKVNCHTSPCPRAAVVFSLTSLLFFTLGTVSGPAADRFGLRPLLLAGAVAFGLGLAARLGDRLGTRSL